MSCDLVRGTYAAYCKYGKLDVAGLVLVVNVVLENGLIQYVILGHLTILFCHLGMKTMLHKCGGYENELVGKYDLRLWN